MMTLLWLAPNYNTEAFRPFPPPLFSGYDGHLSLLSVYNWND